MSWPYPAFQNYSRLEAPNQLPAILGIRAPQPQTTLDFHNSAQIANGYYVSNPFAQSVNRLYSHCSIPQQVLPPNFSTHPEPVHYQLNTYARLQTALYLHNPRVIFHPRRELLSYPPSFYSDGYTTHMLLSIDMAARFPNLFSTYNVNSSYASIIDHYRNTLCEMDRNQHLSFTPLNCEISNSSIPVSLNKIVATDSQVINDRRTNQFFTSGLTTAQSETQVSKRTPQLSNIRAAPVHTELQVIEGRKTNQPSTSNKPSTSNNPSTSSKPSSSHLASVLTHSQVASNQRQNQHSRSHRASVSTHSKEASNQRETQPSRRNQASVSTRSKEPSNQRETQPSRRNQASASTHSKETCNQRENQPSRSNQASVSTHSQVASNQRENQPSRSNQASVSTHSQVASNQRENQPCTSNQASVSTHSQVVSNQRENQPCTSNQASVSTHSQVVSNQRENQPLGSNQESVLTHSQVTSYQRENQPSRSNQASVSTHSQVVSNQRDNQPSRRHQASILKHSLGASNKRKNHSSRSNQTSVSTHPMVASNQRENQPSRSNQASVSTHSMVAFNQRENQPLGSNQESVLTHSQLTSYQRENKPSRSNQASVSILPMVASNQRENHPSRSNQTSVSTHPMVASNQRENQPSRSNQASVSTHPMVASNQRENQPSRSNQASVSTHSMVAFNQRENQPLGSNQESVLTYSQLTSYQRENQPSRSNQASVSTLPMVASNQRENQPSRSNQASVSTHSMVASNQRENQPSRSNQASVSTHSMVASNQRENQTSRSNQASVSTHPMVASNQRENQHFRRNQASVSTHSKEASNQRENQPSRSNQASVLTHSHVAFNQRENQQIPTKINRRKTCPVKRKLKENEANLNTPTKKRAKKTELADTTTSLSSPRASSQFDYAKSGANSNGYSMPTLTEIHNFHDNLPNSPATTQPMSPNPNLLLLQNESISNESYQYDSKGLHAPYGHPAYQSTPVNHYHDKMSRSAIKVSNTQSQSNLDKSAHFPHFRKCDNNDYNVSDLGANVLGTVSENLDVSSEQSRQKYAGYIQRDSATVNFHSSSQSVLNGKSNPKNERVKSQFLNPVEDLRVKSQFMNPVEDLRVKSQFMNPVEDLRVKSHFMNPVEDKVETHKQPDTGLKKIGYDYNDALDLSTSSSLKRTNVYQASESRSQAKDMCEDVKFSVSNSLSAPHLGSNLHLVEKEQTNNSLTVSAVDASCPEGMSDNAPCPEGMSDNVPCYEEMSDNVPCPEGMSDNVPCPEGMSDHVPCDEGMTDHVTCDEGMTDHIPCDEEMTDHVTCDEGMTDHIPCDEGMTDHIPCDEGMSDHVPCYEGMSNDADIKSESLQQITMEREPVQAEMAPTNTGLDESDNGNNHIINDMFSVSLYDQEDVYIKSDCIDSTKNTEQCKVNRNTNPSVNNTAVCSSHKSSLHCIESLASCSQAGLGQYNLNQSTGFAGSLFNDVKNSPQPLENACGNPHQPSHSDCNQQNLSKNSNPFTNHFLPYNTNEFEWYKGDKSNYTDNTLASSSDTFYNSRRLYIDTQYDDVQYDSPEEIEVYPRITNVNNTKDCDISCDIKPSENDFKPSAAQTNALVSYENDFDSNNLSPRTHATGSEDENGLEKTDQVDGQEEIQSLQDTNLQCSSGYDETSVMPSTAIDFDSKWEILYSSGASFNPNHTTLSAPSYSTQLSAAWIDQQDNVRKNNIKSPIRFDEIERLQSNNNFAAPWDIIYASASTVNPNGQDFLANTEIDNQSSHLDNHEHEGNLPIKENVSDHQRLDPGSQSSSSAQQHCAIQYNNGKMTDHTSASIQADPSLMLGTQDNANTEVSSNEESTHRYLKSTVNSRHVVREQTENLKTEPVNYQTNSRAENQGDQAFHQNTQQYEAFFTGASRRSTKLEKEQVDNKSRNTPENQTVRSASFQQVHSLESVDDCPPILEDETKKINCPAVDDSPSSPPVLENESLRTNEMTTNKINVGKSCGSRDATSLEKPVQLKTEHSSKQTKLNAKIEPKRMKKKSAPSDTTYLSRGKQMLRKSQEQTITQRYKSINKLNGSNTSTFQNPAVSLNHNEKKLSALKKPRPSYQGSFQVLDLRHSSKRKSSLGFIATEPKHFMPVDSEINFKIQIMYNYLVIKLEDLGQRYKPLVAQMRLTAPKSNATNQGTSSPSSSSSVRITAVHGPDKAGNAIPVVKKWCSTCRFYYSCSMMQHIDSDRHQRFTKKPGFYASLDELISTLNSVDQMVQKIKTLDSSFHENNARMSQDSISENVSPHHSQSDNENIATSDRIVATTDSQERTVVNTEEPVQNSLSHLLVPQASQATVGHPLDDNTLLIQPSQLNFQPTCRKRKNPESS